MLTRNQIEIETESPVRSRTQRLVAITFALILVSVSPAEALFGSECKKPKSTYSKYLTSSKTLKIKEVAAQAAARSKEESEYFRCTLNPKAFLQEKTLKDTNTFTRNKDGC